MRVHMSGSGHGQGGTVRHETGRGQGGREGTGKEDGSWVSISLTCLARWHARSGEFKIS